MNAPFRYVVVQLLAYGLDVGTFSTMVALAGLAAPYANVCAKIAAGTFAFFAHRHVTFESGGHGGLWDQMARYAALLLLNSFASSGLLALLLLAISHSLAAKVLSDVALTVVSFGLSKTFIFRRRQAAAEGNER